MVLVLFERRGSRATLPSRRTHTASAAFGDRLHFLSNAWDHHPVGLEEVDDGLWSVHFCHLVLARIDERTGTLTRG